MQDVGSSIFNFTLILPLINEAFWLIQAPFGFGSAYGLELCALFLDLGVHFVSSPLKAMLNHKIHRQPPVVNIKLHFTFGDSVSVTLRYLQAKGEGAGDKQVSCWLAALGTIKRISVEGEMCWLNRLLVCCLSSCADWHFTNLFSRLKFRNQAKVKNATFHKARSVSKMM